MDLSVIIVTWNSGHEIVPSLRSIFGDIQASYEVFVVDNASTDGTCNKVIEKYQEQTENCANLHLFRNNTNRGFAAAVNQALKQAHGDYVLLLNPDSELEPGAIASMLAYLKEHPQVGVAGGKVMNTDGSLQPSVRRFPTLADQTVILLKLHRLFPCLTARYLCNDFDYSREQEVDQVRGAYFFISRRALETVGPLDEKNFFIWFEEVDYCKRVKDKGMKVVYFPGSLCRHQGGASFCKALSVHKQRWLNHSMINYFKKHGPKFSYLVLSMLSPVSIFLSAAASLVPVRHKKYL